MLHHKSNVAANTLVSAPTDELHQTVATCNIILGNMILDPTIQGTCDGGNRPLPKSSLSGLFDHGPKHTVVRGLEHRPACQQYPIFSIGAYATSNPQHPVMFACK